ncbi:DUF4251 domain-containing protein [Winogradskyella sp.]|uniref:DUF4251 domain-containing protein n=1 Tax=Winogradskyella sp. TaxID=1883156 RepID=UPI0035C7EDB3
MKKYISLSVLFLVISSFSFSQTRAERKQAKKERIEAEYVSTKELINSGKFQFEARWANPLGNDVANVGQNIPGGGAIFQGGRVDVSSNDNFVNIDGTKADLFLPYFGRVFFPKRINNQGGIQYKGDITNYRIKINDNKQVITIKFEAKTENDYLKFSYRINSGGSATLTVSSTNRQTISYNGDIKVLKGDTKPN